jgi:hypothetical protein
MTSCICARVGLYDGMSFSSPTSMIGYGCHYHGYFSEALLPLQALFLVAWLGVQLCSNLTLVHEFLVCGPAPRVCKLANSAAYHARACKAPYPPPAQLLVPSTIRGVFLALRAGAMPQRVISAVVVAQHHTMLPGPMAQLHSRRSTYTNRSSMPALSNMCLWSGSSEDNGHAWLLFRRRASYCLYPHSPHRRL